MSVSDTPTIYNYINEISRKPLPKLNSVEAVLTLRELWLKNNTVQVDDITENILGSVLLRPSPIPQHERYKKLVITHIDYDIASLGVTLKDYMQMTPLETTLLTKIAKERVEMKQQVIDEIRGEEDGRNTST